MLKQHVGLPEQFLSRLDAIVPHRCISDVLEALNTQRPTTLRVNTLKATVDTVLRAFGNAGIVTRPVVWNPLAFEVVSPSLRELSETPMYKEGLLYVQSLSSMLPPLVLDPAPGDKVLDIAAAPGSKTTQMASMMENTGEIVANDTSYIRRYRLEANLRMQGVTIAQLGKDDGRSIWKRYPEYFDKVLVDAPCSMEGRFYTPDPKTYKDWSTKKIKILSALQRWMLRSAISATKPGGTIVYSTCTLAPEENEAVVDWIVQKEKGNVALEEIHIPHLATLPGLLQWQDKRYDSSLAQTVRIYPNELMEGFFVAKIKKIRTSIPSALVTQT